jgi:hypothetical protein
MKLEQHNSDSGGAIMLDGAINYIATEFGRIAWREQPI